MAALRLLGVVALLLPALSSGKPLDWTGSSSAHSLSYSYTAVSDSGPGLPHFSAVGYVDDQPFVKYDNVMRRAVSQVPWMEKAAKDDPQFWKRETQSLREEESVSRGNLVKLQDHFYQNSNTGVHTLQWTSSCVMGPDGQFHGGSWQYAYDGEGLIAFNTENFTWPTWKLDLVLPNSRYLKSYLEGTGTCVKWLQKLLGYGNKTLLRTEVPTGKVVRKKGYDGRETLICQLYGFYPKEIKVTWMKEGEDRKLDTLPLMGGIVPNSDGTYHIWLSIEVDPEERGQYRCRVRHGSLLEPLYLAWEEPASTVGLSVGIGVGVLAILLVAGVIFYIIKTRRRLKSDYPATSMKRLLEDGWKEKPRQNSQSSDGSSAQESVGAGIPFVKGREVRTLTWPPWVGNSDFRLSPREGHNSQSSDGSSTQESVGAGIPFVKDRELCTLSWPGPPCVGKSDVNDLPGFQLSPHEGLKSQRFARSRCGFISQRFARSRCGYTILESDGYTIRHYSY